MKLISNKYRTELRNYHKQEETWGVGPKWNIIRICKFLYDNNIESVLDYGCGKGWYLPFILPININNYDPAVFKWSIVPKTQDYLLCIDVLEHVEPELLSNVIEHLVSKFNKKALLIISLQEARETLPSGRNAHLTVKPAEWWIELIKKYCVIDKIEYEYRNKKGSHNFNELLLILKK